MYSCRNAGVVQLVECLLPKQKVVGSIPITRLIIGAVPLPAGRQASG